MAGDNRGILLAAIRYLENYQEIKEGNMIDQGPKGLVNQPVEMQDPYRITGKDFPVSGPGKGDESGPKGLVAQSEKQKSPRLNASDGNGPVVRGKEGKAFSASTNGGESDSGATAERATYAGARASVSVSCVDGQISPDIKKERI